MKKAFYGLDWTICFLWAIVVVVIGYGWFPYFPVCLVSLMVLFRIVCSFALYKGEKGLGLGAGCSCADGTQMVGGC